MTIEVKELQDQGVKLSKEVEELLSSLNPEIPPIFRQQARLAAKYIQELDADLANASPDAQELARQLRITGFVDSVYVNHRYFQKGDPRIIIPSWLQKEEATEQDQSLVNKIGVEFARFVSQLGLKGKREQQGTYYAIGEGRPTLPKAQRHKCYIEKESLLTAFQSKRLGTCFGELIDAGINPYDIKLHDGDRLVLYFDRPISEFKQVMAILRKHNIEFRGPAQDVRQVMVSENGDPEEKSLTSNDAALGELGYNPYVELTEPYQQAVFLKRYLQLCLWAGKNPARPYETSFVYLLDPERRIPVAQIEQFKKRAEQLVKYPVFYAQNRRQLADNLIAVRKIGKEAEWQPEIPTLAEEIRDYIAGQIAVKDGKPFLPVDARILYSTLLHGPPQTEAEKKLDQEIWGHLDALGGLHSEQAIPGQIFNGLHQFLEGRRKSPQGLGPAEKKLEEALKLREERVEVKIESAGIESFVGRDHKESEDVGAPLIFDNQLEGMVVFDSANRRQPAERYLEIFKNAYLSSRQSGLSAKDSLSKATEVLRDNDTPRNFATFAAYIIKGQTLYASAIGDPPIYVYSKKEGKVRRINRPVDITAHPNYQQWGRGGKLYSEAEGYPPYRDLATGLKIHQSLGAKGVEDSIVTNEPQKITPVTLEPGDVVIIGSDGLQDNIIDNVKIFMANDKDRYPSWQTTVIDPQITMEQAIKDGATLQEVKDNIIRWAKPADRAQDDMIIGIIRMRKP